MKIEKRLIKDLKPAEYNPRKNTKKQEEDLQKSLKEFGCVEPIIINSYKDRENIVVGGHFRLRELKKLGIKEIECSIVNLPLEKERELNIRLNANSGEWDLDLLANSFANEELQTWGLDFGFDSNILNALDEDIFKNSCTKESDIFSITFNFPIKDKKQIENKIKDLTKEKLTRQIINLLKD